MNAFVLPYAPSEREGFIPERLERLTAAMQRQIDEKKAPGASMLIARHGKLVYRQCLGALRPDGPPMSEDAIFRIYSMTKPIVSVAAMMLVEQGRLSIIDPVSAYIPAFADVKVGVPNGDRLELASPRRPVTVQDLMRHTSGLTYGFTGGSPVQKLTKAADLRSPNRRSRRPSRRSPPFAHASAGRGVGVQLVDRRAWTRRRNRRGRPSERGLARAHIRSARHERHRLLHPGIEARATRRSLLVRLHDHGGSHSCNATGPPKFESGGGGLLSTLADYTRFTAMLSAGGMFEGVRLLSPPTLAFMASDHLAANVRRDHYLLWPGHGFGLGFAVRTDPGGPTAGSVGEFFWGGMMEPPSGSRRGIPCSRFSCFRRRNTVSISACCSAISSALQPPETTKRLTRRQCSASTSRAPPPAAIRPSG